MAQDIFYNEKIKIEYHHGRYFEEFVELQLIGTGSFGIVVKSRFKFENKTYAIKKIPLSLNEIKSIFNEIEIMINLRSEFVVGYESAWIEDNYMNENEYGEKLQNQIFDSGHPVFDPYRMFLLHIQMELCNSNLKQMISIIEKVFEIKKDEKLNPIHYFIASELFKELLESAYYLHKQDPAIIHRDLKPANILITNGGDGRFVKIADFGLAVIHEIDQTHTQGVGTLKYMAPEILRGRNYDTKSDIYSLGIIGRDLFSLYMLEDRGKPLTIEKNDPYLAVINRMTSLEIKNRPTCEQILKEIKSVHLEDYILSKFDSLEEFLSLIKKKCVDYYDDDHILKIFVLHKLSQANFKLFSESNDKSSHFSENESFIKKNLENLSKLVESNKSTSQLSQFINSKNDGYFNKNFEEYSLLGNGEFGVVVEARLKHNNINFAIKKVPITKILKQQEQLIREWNIMAAIEGENIVKYINAWTETNPFDENLFKKYKESGVKNSHPIFNKQNDLILYIQMELCFETLKNVTFQLNSKLRYDKKNELTVIGYYILCELLMEIFEGVRYLHNQKPTIIHRDIKPSNIFITRGINGKFVKIGDFGLAKLQETVNQSNTGGVGSPKYMAPEVESGKYDEMADIHSLGATIQEMFNFDINEEYSEDNDKLILDRYHKLIDLSIKMMDHRKTLRPGWKKILSEKNEWFLDIHNLIDLTEIQSIRVQLECKENLEENFHLVFMQTKLNLLNIVLKNERTPIEPTEMIPELKKTSEFDENFIDSSLIGYGSFSLVFKAKCKNNNTMYVIKKIPVNKQLFGQVVKKLKETETLDDKYITCIFHSWSESNRYLKNKQYSNDIREVPSSHQVFKNGYPILLHVQTELCEFNLEQIIERMDKEFHQPKNTMTTIGYCIASHLLIEVLECVNYMHNLENSLIHTNLNLTNILITNESQGRFIKISDIGSFLFHDLRDITQRSHVTRKSKYIASELMSGDKLFSKKSDIFSIGAITEDLFNMNILNPISNNNDDLFKIKYEKILQYSQKMISHNKNERPLTEDVLQDRNSWALNYDRSMDLPEISASKDDYSPAINFHSFFKKMLERFIYEYKCCSDRKFE